MQINNLDLLHHKILIGHSQGGDVSEYETQLHNELRAGVKNKCPITQDFINRINANKPLVLIKEKNIFLRFLKWDCAFLKTTRKPIKKTVEPFYKIIEWFVVFSIIIAVLMENFYA